MVLVGVIARRFYLKKKQEKEERKLKESLEGSRRSRRARTRQGDISERDSCVVCVSNPKEVNVMLFISILINIDHLCIYRSYVCLAGTCVYVKIAP